MQRAPNADTQTKLSKAAKVTQSTVSRLLTGDVGCSIDVVESLAKALNVNPVILLSDPLKVQFLEFWDKLEESDQWRVIAFMEVTQKTRTQHLTAPVSWSTTHKITGVGRGERIGICPVAITNNTTK